MTRGSYRCENGYLYGENQSYLLLWVILKYSVRQLKKFKKRFLVGFKWRTILVLSLLLIFGLCSSPKYLC